MAKIVYGSPVGYGSTLVKEFVNELIKIKDDGQRIASILKETTVDGAATTNIAAGGTYADVFGVASGQGGDFYNALVVVTTGIVTILNTISDDKLADLDMG